MKADKTTENVYIEKNNEDSNSKVTKIDKTDDTISFISKETPKSSTVNSPYEANFDIPPPLKGLTSDAKESKKIFNDYDDDEDDDLFGEINRNKSNIHDDLFSSEYNDYTQPNKNVSIFSDEPPDYDEPDEIQSNSNTSPNWNSSKLNDNVEKRSIAVKSDNARDEQDDFLNILPKTETKLISDDLFSEKMENENVFKKVDSFTKSPDSLSNKNTLKTKTLVKNEKKLPELKSSDISEDNNDFMSSLQSEKFNPVETDQNKSESNMKTQNIISQKPIKKLQSNVNINVKALMPTSMPKSVKEIKNSVAENVFAPSFTDEETVNDNKLEPTEKVDTPESTLCNNILKERIKIKVKRRPSSRKARHEAIRKSAADIYNFPDTTEHSDEPTNYKSLPNSPEKTFAHSSEMQNENESYDSVSSKNVKSNNLFITDKKNDIPDIPSTRSSGHANASSVIKKDLFSDDDDDIADIFTSKTNTHTKMENSLFAEKSQQKPHIEPKKPDNNKLFGDSDSDSELFSKKESSVTISKTSVVNPDKSSKEKNKYESIFDESDNEDLFTSKKTTVVSKNTTTKGLFGDDDDSDDFDLFKTHKGIQLNIFTLQ